MLINKTISFLKKGQTILYPTDTVWGLGCDATNFDAVKKVYQLKNREESKSLIILVDSFEMLQNYVKIIPEKVNNKFFDFYGKVWISAVLCYAVR